MAKKKWYPHKKPKPGSKQVRHRAKTLNVSFTSPYLATVTGGEAPQQVAIGNIKRLKSYRCDCGMQKFARNGVCSHVYAVWLHRKELQL